MSLSHNLLTSLAGFQHLQNLVSLNLNFNALPSLEGIGACTALQHLFVANNRVRDVSPLAELVHLETLHLFRNQISDLDGSLAVLVHLVKLRELELAGNPCSLCPDYKHRVVLQLELESLDGDAINQLDYDLANEYYAANGGMPAGLGPQVDILTLDEIDGGAGAAAGAGGSEPGADTEAGEGAPDAAARSASDTGTSSAAGALGRTAGGPAVSTTAAEANGRAPTTAWVPLPRPGSAAARSLPAGTSGMPPRPGTAMRPVSAGMNGRPGTAGFHRPGSSGLNGRPGSAYSGLQASVQLLSNEILNDHPLIIEYLAKHVLQEGLAVVEAGNAAGGGGGRPGSGGSGGRGPSFAQRLRDTAAAMNACEEVDPKALAEQRQELIATSWTVRRGIAEEMVSSASPNELIRQLVRLCEVLIKEVESCRAGRPSTSAGSGGVRPGTATGVRPTTPGPGGSAGAASTSGPPPTAEAAELAQLRVEVERLCRENKALRLENANMEWLAEEVKRLKKELAAAAGAAAGTGGSAGAAGRGGGS
ncbi:hypothetical protein HYH03_012340 [Edaphochlamys debaryana]|uniref:Uncharacterized protein n=1 Tax=Edaphochlamys debaryana TaxID=47281 RepID=A0A836BVK7_9CHLO|nr:hypothetical protein HYH03_012340 [Edaphochlamys debaryana]|eukprot:KAG2489114.1 hypothetical protein HYH03_012340 [Edaphochlamys debaryana]